MTDHDTDPELITPEEAARLTGLTLEQLARLRDLGAGPEWGQISRRTVRYLRTEVEAWQAGPGPKQVARLDREGDR